VRTVPSAAADRSTHMTLEYGKKSLASSVAQSQTLCGSVKTQVDMLMTPVLPKF